MSAALHTVHVRVNDAATGQPTAVRVRFSQSQYVYFAPLGRLADLIRAMDEDVGGNVELGAHQYAYIDGTCEIRLPADPVAVEISKGFEYLPIQREVTLGPGKLALRFTLERWIDLRDQGWYSGDTSAFFLSPHGALLEGAAEGLAVINLLAVEWPVFGREPPEYRIPNIVAFSGQQPALEKPGHLVVVNTHNCGMALGYLNLLNCHRAVYPLSIGLRPEDFHDWTLADWCDQCHRKGGLVLCTEFAKHGWEEEESLGQLDGEALADVVLGKVDALEVTCLDWSTFHQITYWYRLLNAGFRIPLAGGSGKRGVYEALGCIRTYARLQPGEEFNYKNWIEAVRGGRSFVTNGPLLTFTVNGQDAGAIIDLPPGTQSIQLSAEARSLVPFEQLELVHNGITVAAARAEGSPCRAVLEGEWAAPSGGWLAVRCWGQQKVSAGQCEEPIAAHSSPVYVRIEGQSEKGDPAAMANLIERLEKMLVWVEKYGRFENDRQRERLQGIFHSARNALQQRLDTAEPCLIGTEPKASS